MQRTLTTIDEALAHYRLFLEKVAMPKVVAGTAYRFNMYERVDWDMKPKIAEDSAPMRAVFLLAYDALSVLQKEDVLETVRKIVQEPMLEDMLASFASPASQVSALAEGKRLHAEQFAEQLMDAYAPRIEQRGGALMQILKPLKTLLFLQALAEHPDLHGAATKRLAPNSAHFPHRLFKPIERLTNKEIEMEIAETLPTLYSDKLVERVTHISDLIEQDKGKRREFSYSGKYRLPQGLWWKAGATQTEKRLDELYGEPEIKKDILYTLASCFVLTEETARTKGKKARNLPHFSVPPTQYGLACDLMRAYARNQMLSVFQKTNGVAFAVTFLTKTAQLAGKIDGDLLIVTDNYHRASERLTIDSSLRQSSYEIPLCAYLLNRFYAAAREIAAP